MGLFRNLLSCICCDPEDPTRLLQSRSATPIVNAAGAPNNGDDGGSARNEASGSIPITVPVQSPQDNVLPRVRSDPGDPTRSLQGRSATPTLNAAGGPDNGNNEPPEASRNAPITGPIQMIQEGSTILVGGEVGGTNGSDDKESTKNKADISVKVAADPGDEESDDDEWVWNIVHSALGFAETAVDASGVFPPFQIIAVGLKLILEHAESASENRKAAEELKTRIDQLKLALKGLPSDDPDALDGSQRLLKKLQKITKKLGPMSRDTEINALQDKCIRFIKASKNAGILQDCIKTVDNALTDYQLWMTQRIFAIVWEQSIWEENKAAQEAHDLEDRIEVIMRVLENSPDDPSVVCECQRLSEKLNPITNILNSMEDLSTASTLRDKCARLAGLQGYVKTVDNALMAYQLSMTQRICGIGLQQLKSEEKNALYRIKRADQASFFAEDRPKCLEGTRKEVMDALQYWALSESGPQFFWLNGPAGSGKSTIAQTFAHWLHLKDKLGASFFCSRNSEARGDLKMIFPTIAFQLATPTNIASPRFRGALFPALEPNPDGASLSLRNQLHNFVVQPAETSDMKTVIVIDALDECSDDSRTSKLLDLLGEVAIDVPSLKIFITSRPESNIRASFHRRPLVRHSDRQSLNDVTAASIDRDIKLFLKTGLTHLATKCQHLHIEAEWPSDEVVDGLAIKAAGLFIFASTVLKFVDNPRYDPRDQIEKVYSNLDDSKIEGSQGLDKLYLEILDNAAPKQDDEFEQRLLAVLGLLVVARDALTPTIITLLLGLKRDTDVLTTLDSLHSLIIVSQDISKPIRFQHKSIPDFLTNKDRCTDPRFYVDRDAHHFFASSACLRLLERLKKNICSVPRYTFNADIDPEQIRTNISETMRYCCRYWVDHLLAGDEYARARFSGIQPLLLHFLQMRQLQWFEVLALLQELRYAVESLNRLRTWLSSLNRINGQYQDTLDWVIDGRKFVLYAFDVINVSAAHIYHSVLPFAPRASLLRQQHYEESGEARIIRGAEEAWPESDRTFQVPGRVHTLEYAPDGSMIAVGGDTFRHIYRASTGERIFEFNHPSGKLVNEAHDAFMLSYMFYMNPTKRHLAQAHSITFSWDRKTIATASGPEVILWDCTTGDIVGTLQAPQKDGPLQNQIIKLEFHPTFHHLLLSCNLHGRIFLCDTRTTTFHTICVIGDGGDICWLKRSQEKKVVVRLRCQGPIELWDVEAEPARMVKSFEHSSSKSAGSDGDICASKSAGSGRGASASSPCGCDLGRSSYAMSTVASSEDGSFVASTLGSSSFAVYDAVTGDCVKSIHPDRCSTTQGLQFLPGGQVILLSSSINPKSSLLRVWPHSDYSTGDTVLALTHSFINCLVISPGGDTIVFSRGNAFAEVYDTTTPQNTQQHASYSDDTGPSLPTQSHHFSINGELFCTSTSTESESIVQVWYTDHGTPCGVFRVPRGLRDAIVLKDNIHAITLHSASFYLILWNIRMGTKVAQASTYYRSDDAYILPYTHDDAIGCFHTYKLGSYLDREDSMKYKFECYTFSAESKALVKAAQGTLSKDCRLSRVYHEARSSQGDVTLHVQCSFGEHFSVVWKDATSVGMQPQLLDFVQEGEWEISAPEQRLAYNRSSWQGCVGSERQCRYSPSQQYEHDNRYYNKGWVYNEQGIPILWIPPSHRVNRSVQHKEAGKLAWVVEGHGLLLVDISHVHTNPTDKPFGMF